MTRYRAPHGCSAEDSLWSSGRRYPQRIGVRHPGAHHYPCRICWAFHLLPRWPPRARAHPSSVPLLLPATSPLDAPPSFACQLTSGRPCNPSLSSIISFISSGRETKTSRPRTSSDGMRPEYDSSVHCPLTMLRSMSPSSIGRMPLPRMTPPGNRSIQDLRALRFVGTPSTTRARRRSGGVTSAVWSVSYTHLTLPTIYSV